MLTKRKTTMIAILLSVLFINAIATAGGNTILDFGYYNGYTVWATAVNEGDLMKSFTEKGPYTVFIATDEAYRAADLDEAELRRVILHNTLKGAHNLEELGMNPMWRTALGGEIRTAWIDGSLYINETIRVTQSDFTASNGIIHIVDAVNPIPDWYNETLAPVPWPVHNSPLEALARRPEFSRFVSEIEGAGLEHLLNKPTDMTIFAPTNDVFEALPTNYMTKLHSNHDLLRQTLLFHVIPEPVFFDSRGRFLTALGEWMYVDRGLVDWSTHIVGTELVGDSVIHAIDKVLAPSFTLDYEHPDYGHPDMPVLDGDSLLAVAQRDGRLSKFVHKIETAGMEQLLTQHGDFTLIAPTDAAFERMNPELARDCMVDHRLLKQLMLYHVVYGDWTRAEMAEALFLPTALDEMLPINGFRITGSLSAANGTIYIVDAVSVPPVLLTR